MLALFALRIAINTSCLLLIGFALHGAVGVLGRDILPRWRGFGLILAAAATVFALARLPLLNVQMGDASTLFDPDLTALGWMAIGPSSLAITTGAFTIAVGLLLGRRAILAAGALVTAAGFSLTGHTQALPEPGVAPYAVGLHAAVAGFWVIAPLTLFPRATVSNDALLSRLRRFSAAAVFLIPVLFAAGIWLAWVLAGGINGLLGAAYGQLLLLKLAVAIVALGVGALNKGFVTDKVETDAETGRRWLRRTLIVDAVLFTIAIVSISAATSLTGAGEALVAE